MITHLPALGTDTLTADVAVVGAGIAGLILADRLAARGLSVAVLESGTETQESETHPLNAVDTLAEDYGGALLGRARCLGGTSTRWGGALIPFRPDDFLARPHRASWPITFEALAPYVAGAETLFGVVSGPYEPDLPGWSAQAGFVPREAKWPPFRQRNVASLLSSRLSAADGPTIILDATVTGCAFAADNTLTALKAASADGAHHLTVAAGIVVLCPGAIEATRLLLWFDRLSGETAIAGRAHLGWALQDHLSVPLGVVETERPAALNRLCGFRFDRGTMRSLRFEFAPEAQREAGAGSGFVHIAPRPHGVTGFDHVKTFFRSVQRRKPDFAALFRAGLDAPYVAELVRWRLLKQTLYWPRPADYEVHVVAEQSADPDNAITLSETLDPFGVPRAAIAWRRTSADLATMRAISAAFSDYFAKTPLSATGKLSWTTPPDDLALTDIARAGDIYHPVGTTPMAESAEAGVVDGNLAVFGVPNLFVAATSAFPGGGGANPTLMLTAFALRLAEHLSTNTQRVR